MDKYFLDTSFRLGGDLGRCCRLYGFLHLIEISRFEKGRIKELSQRN